MASELSSVLKILDLGNVADYRSADLPYGKQRLLEIAVAFAGRPRDSDFILATTDLSDFLPEQAARYLNDNFRGWMMEDVRRELEAIAQRVEFAWLPLSALLSAALRTRTAEEWNKLLGGERTHAVP